jgi:hypothetical protein
MLNVLLFISDEKEIWILKDPLGERINISSGQV